MNKNNILLTWAKQYPMIMANSLYLPLIILHSFMPLYWYRIIPEVSENYYVAVLLYLFLLSIPSLFSSFIVLKFTSFRLRYKYLIFIGLFLSYFIIGQKITNIRIHHHLKVHGVYVTSKIVSTENKETFVRHKFLVNLNNQNIYGYFDIENDLMDEIDSDSAEIIISELDPKVYQLVDY